MVAFLVSQQINCLFLSIKWNLRQLLKTFLIQPTINHDSLEFFELHELQIEHRIMPAQSGGICCPMWPHRWHQSMHNIFVFSNIKKVKHRTRFKECAKCCENDTQIA